MIKIGARGSKLSIAQVKIVQEKLKNQLNEDSEFIPIKSLGDLNISVPINKVVQEGAFTSTLETALILKEIDMAVHSFKDLPTTNPEGLKIVAVLKRHNANDSLIIHKDKINFIGKNDFTFNNVVRIGTGSARRQTQLLHYYPTISTIDIRGNVETRLKKLERGQYDGIILASAVFQRIKLEIPENYIKVELDIQRFPTAPAQGAICIQMRSDHPLFGKVSQLNDNETQHSVELERNILKEIGGGCQLPLGVTIHQSNKDWVVNLTLASQNWRDFEFIQLTKVILKDNLENLINNLKFLLPKNFSDNKLILQNKEIIFFGNKATIAKYDNFISSFGAITTSIDLQDTYSNWDFIQEFTNSSKLQEIWLASDWVIVTSKNSIHALNLLNKQVPKRNLKVASIGFSTTKLLQKNGYAVHFQAEESTSENLAKGLLNIISKEESVLYLSAENAKTTLKEAFMNEGFNFTQIAVYSSSLRNNLPKIPLNYFFDFAIAFSPEYAKLAVETYGPDIGNYWISIGDSTTQKFQQLGIKKYIQLRQITVEGLLEVLI
jgi:hydroxymethylbilane synthase